MTKPNNFAKTFKANEEKRKQALLAQARKTMEDGAKFRNRVAEFQKNKDQQKKEE